MNINIGGFFFYYFVCIYFINFVKLILSFPGGHSGKEPTSQCRRYNDSWVRKIPLEKEMAMYSSILAWKIPRTEEASGLQSTGLQRVGHTHKENIRMYFYVKQRHYFADKGLSSQSCGFFSSHVWMWKLDKKESWELKNWCFWTMVLEKTLESPFDSKEIQPINPKGNPS